MSIQAVLISPWKSLRLAQRRLLRPRGRRTTALSEHAPELDRLLIPCQPSTYATRVEWLRDLLGWIGKPASLFTTRQASVAHARVRFLLQLMERDTAAGQALVLNLATLLEEADAEKLCLLGGIPQHPGLWHELYERILHKCLPRPDYQHDALTLIGTVLGGRDTALWLDSLPDSDARRLGHLVLKGLQISNSLAQAPGPIVQGRALRHESCVAMLGLAADVQSAGLSWSLRQRSVAVAMVDTPFRDIVLRTEHFVSRYGDHRLQDTARLPVDGEEPYRALLHQISRCEETLEGIYRHFDDTGVSVGIVYRVERCRAQLRRMLRLASLLAVEDPRRVVRFVSAIAIQQARQDSVRHLLEDNVARLSRSIADRNAETGSHYIARDRASYRHMLWASAGGGALMALAVFIKLWVSSAHLPLFFEGLFASCNYAFIFVLIQLLGFTVATKQPAMTAPALATSLRQSQTHRLHRVIETVTALTRSQVAAVSGNLALVIPCTLALAAAWWLSLGEAPMSVAKAHSVLQAQSLLGPSLLFAAFTGVLLWLSGLIAGWADNAFAFRQLGPALASNRRLIRWFGVARVGRGATWLKRQMAGLAGNISLGILLGMTPVIAAFFGVPLEVRHVTLSTGQVAIAAFTLGLESLATPAFWSAAIGLLGIALLNVGVGFWLSFRVALKARNISEHQQHRIAAAVRRQLRLRPLAFLLPPKPAASHKPGINRPAARTMHDQIA